MFQNGKYVYTMNTKNGKQVCITEIFVLIRFYFDYGNWDDPIAIKKFEYW